MGGIAIRRTTIGVMPSCCAAFLLRIALMIYGIWQDSTMLVHYTDVDYHVFTDAAILITEGKSPYLRPTYRYSPLLAGVLTGNIHIGMLFGKTLFIVCDVFAGYLIYRIVLLKHCHQKLALLCAQLWWFNPLPMAVSSRGNAESIMAMLVLATLYCAAHTSFRSQIAAYVLYALSVHLKIYPVTYALPIYLSLIGDTSKRLCVFSRCLHIDVLLNRKRIMFIVTSALTFLLLALLCYWWCGWDFIHETYLYHLTRRDIRHNFSPYFYMLYLVAELRFAPLLGLVVFLPQIVLLIFIATRYHSDLPFCCFLQTFVFVSFNKVCTSQYFLWYLCLLPVSVPNLSMSCSLICLLVALWFLGQGVWLWPAYLLEFEGRNSFLFIWMAGLLFFCINVFILHKLIISYRRFEAKFHGVRHIHTIGELPSLFWHKAKAALQSQTKHIHVS